MKPAVANSGISDRQFDKLYILLYDVSTVRVIDTPRLWDNRKQTGTKRSVIWFVSHAALIGFILAGGWWLLADHSAIVPTLLPHVPVHTSSHQITAKPKPSGHVAGKTIGLDPFQPETDNPSSLLVKKILAMPPPLPAPNCAVDACVALTFDDGPNPDSTPIILDALKQNGAKATFFEVGRLIVGQENYLRRMQAEDDEIGNHTWAHPHLTKLTPEQVDQQIQQTQQAITAIGLPAPTLFRPPYEDINPQLLSQIHLAVILWNVDPKDWAQKDSDSVARIVEQQIKPGAIIVMHDKKVTAGAVDKILKDLRGKYRFVTVSTLLNLTPNAQGVYIGR